jgi:hypothetical protein
MKFFTTDKGREKSNLMKFSLRAESIATTRIPRTTAATVKRK